MIKQWFDVDKTGLGKQAEEQAKGRLIGELVQNGLDEAGVTKIEITRTRFVSSRRRRDLSLGRPPSDSPQGHLRWQRQRRGSRLTKNTKEPDRGPRRRCNGLEAKRATTWLGGQITCQFPLQRACPTT